MSATDPAYTVRNIGVDVDVDVEGLNRTLLLYVNVLGVSLEKFYRRQARLLCQDMLDYTVPFEPDPPTSGSRAGRNAMARVKGVESVERDLDRVFQPLARAGWADIAEVDSFGIFNAWILSRKSDGYSVPRAFEDGAGTMSDWQSFRSVWKGRSGFFHEDQKPDYSTVYGGGSIEEAHLKTRGGPNDYKKGMSSTQTVFLVADYQSQMARYKRQVTKRVGKLKAGWYTAGMMVGDVPVSAPKWIIENQWGTGTMVDELSSRPVFSITIGNTAHDRMTGQPGFGMWENALSHRAYSIRNELARRLSNRRRETVEQAIYYLEAHGLFEVETNPF